MPYNFGYPICGDDAYGFYVPYVNELPSFRLRWKNLGLSDDDLKNLEKELLDDPKDGDV